MFLVSILSEQPNHHQGWLGTYWAAPAGQNIIRGHCGHARTCVWPLYSPHATPRGRRGGLLDYALSWKLCISVGFWWFPLDFWWFSLVFEWLLMIFGDFWWFLMTFGVKRKDPMASGGRVGTHNGQAHVLACPQCPRMMFWPAWGCPVGP